MKKKIILPVITGFAIIALSASTVVNSGGTANWTGSPVDGALVLAANVLVVIAVVQQHLPCL